MILYLVWYVKYRYCIYYRLFMYVLSLNIQLLRGNGCDPTNRFNPATFLCLFQARIWIANVVVFFVLWVQLRCEVIVRFFDIGGIDDHRCLNFLFMMLQKYNFSHDFHSFCILHTFSFLSAYSKVNLLDSLSVKKKICC